MYEASAFTPAFTYSKDKDNRYVFQVTDTRSDAHLARVSFRAVPGQVATAKSFS